jgi:hypothetical protein
MVGSCEHGNEPSGSINGEEVFDQLSVLLVSQEGLCSMEFVPLCQRCSSQFYLHCCIACSDDWSG